MLSFETLLLTLALSGATQGETVLLDFSATWCAPCGQMKPVVQQLAQKGYPVREIDFDTHGELAGRFGVDQLPSFVMLVDGKEVDRVVGSTSFSRLEQMCRLAERSHSSPPVKLASITIPEAQAEHSEPFGSTVRSGWSSRNPSDGKLIAATVRLRIQDSAGYSAGTGTIIDTRGGQALILTCGHIFRDSQGKGLIKVDLFGPAPMEQTEGHLVSYDLDRDVGLLWIHVPGPVAALPVAPVGYRVASNDQVVSLGCSNGGPPTARHTRVCSLDKFMGPANLQVAGLPVQGRSGGGLFSSDGLVIGVCNAADPEDREGLYAALPSIHAMLDEAKLSAVYRGDDGTAASEATLLAADPPHMAREMPRARELVPVSSESPPRADVPADSSPPDRWQQLNGQERAVLEEIARWKAEDTEVICVIRSRSNPQAPSEIVVLDKVSPSFLKQLAGDARSEDQLLQTSLDESAAGPPTANSSPARESPLSSPRRILEYRASDSAPVTASGRPAWQLPWLEPGTIRR